MADFNPTQEQILATNYDRHISLKANAGSGKTTVLIDRYLKILTDSWNGERLKVHPAEIVALTFTKKAAGDMLQKASKTVEKKLAELNIGNEIANRDEIKMYNAIRFKLTYARISTFHSFANAVMRDYPIEAGVNPNFGEIDEVEKIKLRDDSIREVLLARLENNNQKTVDEINELIDLYSLKRIKDWLIELSNSKEKFLLLKSVYAKSDEEFLEKCEEEKCRILSKYIIELDANIKNVVVNNPPYEISSKTYHQKLEIYLSHPAPKITNDIEKIKGYLENITNFLKAKYSRKGIKGYINDTLRFNIETEYIGKINRILAVSKNHSQIGLKHSRLLFEMASEVFTLIDDEKNRKAVMDFDDMIIKFRDMLVEKPHVAEMVRKEMKFLLVDEFQDTNQIQYDIIRALVPGLTNPDIIGTAEDYPKLFLVGDAKQSIYGFRNADVRVFTQAIDDIKEAQSEFGTPDFKRNFKSTPKISPTSDELCGDLSLRASFRMKPVLAAFVNDVFNELMRKPEGDKNSFHIDYEEIVSGRSDKNIDYKEYLDKHKSFPDSAGNIDFIMFEVDSDKQNNGSEDDEKTADFEEIALAKYVKKIVAETDLEYRSIAIISRTKGNFNKLAEIFANHNIPISLESGKGFYQAHEIQILIKFLQFLFNNSDDLALASVLKSDYFGINDTSLLSIANFGDGILWDNFCQFTDENSERTDSEYFKLKNAKYILLELQNYAERLSLSSLIHKIENLTVRKARVMGASLAKKINNNIEKFIEIAYSYEERGFLGIHDFIDYVSTLADISDEGEATSGGNENTVKVLTMHASKGLEYPCVLFYQPEKDLSRSGGSKISITDEQFGFNFKVRSEEDGGASDKDSLQYILSNLSQKEKERAESIRLMYVLLTRAEERIAIPIKVETSKEDNTKEPKYSFLKMLLDSLGLSVDKLQTMDEVRRKSNITLLKDSKNHSFENIPYSISVLDAKNFNFEDIEDIEDVQIQDKSDIPQNVEDLEEVKILMDNIYQPEEEYYFSATKMALFEKDEKLFAKKYMLGMSGDANDEARQISHESGESRLNNDASKLGIVIHQILSEINDWYDFKNKSADTTLLRESVSQAMMAESLVTADDKLFEQILNEVEQVIKTDFINNGQYNFETAEPELELSIAYKNDFITGTLDMLISHKETGEYEIWDWKTNVILDENDLQKKADYYRPQLFLYTYLLSKMYPNQEQFTARLLFTKRAAKALNDEYWIKTFVWNKEDIAKESADLDVKLHDMKHEICMDLPNYNF